MKTQKSNTWRVSVSRVSLLLATLIAATGPGSLSLLSAQQIQSQHDGQVTVSFTEPIQKCIVASGIAGVIQDGLVNEGDRVAVGEKLAVISHGVLLAELKIAVARSESVAQLDAASANLKIKQERKETIESLIDSGHVNKFELEERNSEYDQALAEFRAAENALKLGRLEVERIKAQISDRIIHSPIDGFVAEIHKQPGEHVSASQPQYATLVRLNELKVRFYLDEATLDMLEIGSKVQLLVGDRRQILQATVYFVSPIIDADSGTGRVDLRIENHDLKIRSGSTCQWTTPGNPNNITARK